MFGDSSLYHQGIAVELLRGPAPAGSHLDVGCARHDGQALHPLSDPLRRLRLTAGLRHRHGALRPAAGGEIQNRREKKRSSVSQTAAVATSIFHERVSGEIFIADARDLDFFFVLNNAGDESPLSSSSSSSLGSGRFQMSPQKLPRSNQR